MNFESIKAGFVSYLSEKLGESEGNAVSEVLQNSSVSIFMYSSEFKDYLVEETGADVSIFSKSISEIMQMDVVNGKLVDEAEENTDSFMTEALNEAFSDESVISALDSDNSGDLNEDEINIFLSGLSSDENGEISFDSLAEAVTGIQEGTYEVQAESEVAVTSAETDEGTTTETKNTAAEEGTTIENLLAKTYENKTVIKALDTDGDSVLSDEEKAKFEEYIKGYDGDDSELSETDIQKAVAEIIEGKFSYEETSEDGEKSEDTSTSIEETDDTSSSTSADTEVSNTGSTSSTGSTGSAGSTGSGSAVSSAASSSTTDDSLESKSLSELETIQSEREDDVSEAQEKVNAVYSGENTAVKEAEEEYEDAREAYDEAVKNDDNISDDLKNRRTENLDAIEEKEDTIDNLNISINDKDAEISEAEDTISADNATLSGYKTSLSKLQSQSSDDEEKQQEIDNAIDDVEKAISDLEAQIDREEDDLETLKEEKEDYEDQLSTAEKELTKLEETREDIEEEILDCCSSTTKKALESYNDAKNNVSEVKESELSTAKSELEEAQAALDEVNEVINTKKEEEAEKEYSVSSGSLPDDLFSGALEGQEDLVAEIAEKYDIEPEFLAAIICLESGYGSSNLAVNHNNFGGVTGSGDNGKTSSGFASYSSVEAGLEAMAKNLAAYSSRYSDVNSVDIDNVSAIGSHYCVGGDWANKVTTLYNKIKNMES